MSEFNKSESEQGPKIITKTTASNRVSAEIKKMEKNYPNYNLKFVNNYTRNSGLNGRTEYVLLTFELSQNRLDEIGKRLEKIESQLAEITRIVERI